MQPTGATLVNVVGVLAEVCWTLFRYHAPTFGEWDCPIHVLDGTHAAGLLGTYHATPGGVCQTDQATLRKARSLRASGASLTWILFSKPTIQTWLCN
jgi:hypothetical protein